MPERNEPRIVSAQPQGLVIDIGAAAAKAMPPGRRYRYKQALTYTLEDGRTVTGQADALTKPKLAQEIERKQRHARDGELFASLDDSGQLRYVIMRMTIGIGSGGKARRDAEDDRMARQQPDAERQATV